MKDAMRAARMAAGLTLRELSSMSTVALSTISNWENGYGKPTVESAILAADALGISLDRYVGHKTQYRQTALHNEFYLMKKFLRECGLMEDYEAFKKEENDG